MTHISIITVNMSIHKWGKCIVFNSLKTHGNVMHVTTLHVYSSTVKNEKIIIIIIIRSKKKLLFIYYFFLLVMYIRTSLPSRETDCENSAKQQQM